jgi:predicted  nucleic acid-binding Zn-ribbon protein
VEQREGRILRQGNNNPQIEIYRYVTEESFDAYMWQTLETKAKFIAQVMTGESNLRRIEDVDGAALTYAEVKAIASGNPMVIEKAGVDAEVARLTRLRSQHGESVYKLRYQLRHLTDEIPRLERRLEDTRRDISLRRDTSGDKFVIELEGEQIRDRGLAGELVLRRADKMRGVAGQKAIGTLAGFQILVADNCLRGPEIVLKGASVHTVGMANTALGMTRSLEYTVQNLDETAATITANISSTKKRIADVEEQTGQSFEYAEKLERLVRRQQEITDALDLSKNQAPAQAEASAPEQPDDANRASEKQAPGADRRNGRVRAAPKAAGVSV